jgi:hypothetical protein
MKNNRKNMGSLQWYVNKFGKCDGIIRYETTKKNRAKGFTLEKMIEKYGIDEGMKRYEHFKKSRSHTKDSYIKKYGIDEGTKKWDMYIEKCKKSHTLKNYIKTYGEKQGHILWEQFKSKSALTLKNFQSRYGIKEGRIKYINLCKIRQHQNSIEYFINRYGKKEGESRWQKSRERKSKSKTLQRFIEIYGDIDGLKRYNQYRSSLKITNSLTGYLNKYGQIEGLSRWREISRKKTERLLLNYSKISQQLFYEILNFIDDKENVFFAEHGGESQIGLYRTDFKYNNKIIEFFGDVFHANPSIFKEWNQPNPFNTLTSLQLWEKDKKRLEYLHSCGYKSLIIWENEYNTDSDSVIIKCLEFLGINEVSL